MADHHSRSSDRSFLHLSMRPVSGRSSVLASGGPWAVFGWTMIVLAVTAVVLMIIALMIFLGEPGPPTGT